MAERHRPASLGDAPRVGADGRKRRSPKRTEKRNGVGSEAPAGDSSTGERPQLEKAATKPAKPGHLNRMAAGADAKLSPTERVSDVDQAETLSEPDSRDGADLAESGEGTVGPHPAGADLIEPAGGLQADAVLAEAAARATRAPDIFGEVPELSAAAQGLKEAEAVLRSVLDGWSEQPGPDVEPVLEAVTSIVESIAAALQTLENDVMPIRPCSSCAPQSPSADCYECQGSGWLSAARLLVLNDTAAEEPS